MNYEEALKAEINKREANKSETGLEWACDALLQSELNRIQDKSESFRSQVADNHITDEKIHDIEISIYDIKERIHDNYFFQSYAAVALLLGIVNTIAMAILIVGL